MLNWSFVLERVKDELQVANQPLEKTDEEIVDYLKRNALKKFERYYPDRNIITLNTSDSNVKVPGKQSMFYIFDPEDREVINVVEMITQVNDLALLGHDYTGFGALTFSQIQDIVLANNLARNTLQYSRYNYTTEFISPNILRILPKFDGVCAIEYERSHDPELSSIEPSLQTYFVDLCLGMSEMWIAKLRQKFSTYNTPFGEINLNADAIYNDGKDLYDKTIEKLETSCQMNIIFDCG